MNGPLPASALTIADDLRLEEGGRHTGPPITRITSAAPEKTLRFAPGRRIVVREREGHFTVTSTLRIDAPVSVQPNQESRGTPC
jgi:hypothetical protein